MSESESRSLVTGGAGFIGSHLVDALLERGDRVIVVDDLSSGRRENLEAALAGDQLELVEEDISAAPALSAIAAEFSPGVIFHLAAQVDVRKAIEDPIRDAEVNVLGTINVLEAARSVEGCPIIFSSTGGAIYGEGLASAEALPFAETAKVAPESVYGTSKLAGEEYLALYRRLHGVPSLAMRFGNVYGPRQDPGKEAGVIAIFCGRLAEGVAPTVFGDGTQTRDYIYVADVVAGLLAADRALAATPELEGPYNLGTGVEASVLELVEILSGLADDPLPAKFKPARKGEVLRSVISAAAAESELQWRPQVSLLDGLRRSFESVREARAGSG